MKFDPENKIVKLCARGMEASGEEASALFMKAWNESENDMERFVAAHYVARIQESVEDKLKWDEVSLDLAQLIDTDEIRGVFPSLYLNIAKCHEDLGDYPVAKVYYENALIYTEYLSNDGYGNLIKNGILNGVDRVSSL